MYIIAGLGNPGREYEKTRHNAGFEVIDRLAERLQVLSWEKKHKALAGKAVYAGEKLLLLKPQTYMNLSGESLLSAASFYRVTPDHILVISDDIDLAEGRLRIRKSGSAGGHNGLKSIISNLGSADFVRIRVGVGSKPAGSCGLCAGAHKGRGRRKDGRSLCGCGRGSAHGSRIRG